MVGGICSSSSLAYHLVCTGIDMDWSFTRAFGSWKFGQRSPQALLAEGRLTPLRGGTVPGQQRIGREGVILKPGMPGKSTILSQLQNPREASLLGRDHFLRYNRSRLSLL